MKLWQKFSLSFSLIIVVIGLSSALIYQETKVARQMRVNLTSNTIPLSKILAHVDTEVNGSLASLRGYLLLGDEVNERKYFLSQRAKAWRVIERNLLRLEGISLNDDVQRRLEELQSQLRQLRALQQEVEEVAWTDRNVPAENEFQVVLLPESNELSQILAKATRALANDSSLLLSSYQALADMRERVHRLTFLVREFLRTQDRVLLDNIKNEQRKIGDQAEDLELFIGDDLGEDLKWDKFKSHYLRFNQSLTSVLNDRLEPDWHVANYNFKNRIMPLVEDILRGIDDLQNLVDVEEDIATENLSSAEQGIVMIILVATLATVVFAIFIAVWLSRYVSTSISEVRRKADELAIGYLDGAPVSVQGHDELLGMAQSLNGVADYLQYICGQASLIANGELQLDFKTRSERDQLAETLIDMLESFRRIESQAKAIAQHNYDIEIVPRSDNDLLSKSLEDMLISLRDSELKNELQNWIKSGLNELNTVLRKGETPAQLGETVLSFLADYLDAAVAGFYTIEGDCAVLQASYAYSRRRQDNFTFKIGEGLLGQALKERRRLYFSSVPSDYIELESGLGRSSAYCLLAIPLVYNDELKAGMELAFTFDLEDKHFEFLDLAMESIAIAVHTLQARKKVDDLLEETRKTSAALEEKTQALQTSEESLRQQQRELEKNNVDLEAKTAELEQSKEELEQRNLVLNELKVSLEERAIELQRASKYKSDFLSNMSHELRTPLNSLLILANSLAQNESGALTKEDVEAASVIYQAGNDLLSLINEILDLSKIEAGRLDILPEQFSMAEVVKNMQRLFEPLAEQKSLTFCIDNPLQDMQLYVDRKRLEQILKNLLSNAIKFTEQGSVELSLRTTQQDGEEWVEFTVKDTGIGLKPEQEAIIFDAFQQADGSTSRKYGGTGLGLTISRQLAQLMGGDISVVSRIGEGSAFTLSLPSQYSLPSERSSTNEGEEKSQTDTGNPEVQTDASVTVSNAVISEDLPKSDGADEETLVNLKSKDILIVEDNDTFAKTVGNVLRKHDYRPIFATTVDQGLKVAVAVKPRAIILDVGLPDGSGLDLLSSFKKHPDLRHIPVQVVSGMDLDMDLVVRLGAMGVTRKPLEEPDLERLMACIERSGHSQVVQMLIVAKGEEQKRLSGLFSQQNVVCTEANDIDEALQSFDSYQPVLIIIDQAELYLETLNQLFEEVVKWESVPKILLTNTADSPQLRGILEPYAGIFAINPQVRDEALIQQTMLFLHRLESELPSSQREMLLKYQLEETDINGKRILIVDDDMRNTFALSRLLAHYGLKTEKAGNGKEALERLADQHFDAVLMDIMMPEMDGYEAISKIRENKKWDDLPVIALTAKAMEQERDKCIMKGAQDFLSKPVDPQRLIAVLNVWLTK